MSDCWPAESRLKEQHFPAYVSSSGGTVVADFISVAGRKVAQESEERGRACNGRHRKEVFLLFLSLAMSSAARVG